MNVHVVPHAGLWAIKQEGVVEPMQTFPTETEAVTAGREIAMRERGELFIHGRGGEIRDRRSYGHDPRGRG